MVERDDKTYFSNNCKNFYLAYFGQTTSIPTCDVVTETLYCLKSKPMSNKSRDEHIFNLIATLYKMVMDELMRIKNTLDSITNLIKVGGIGLSSLNSRNG